MVSTVKQVAGDDAGGLLAHECSSGGGGPPWGRVQPVAVERGTDRDGRDLHAESKELALDALVAPARVLLGQADDQLLDVGIQLRPARCTMGIGPGPGDQPPMPAQQRRWRDEAAGPAGWGQDAADRGEQARSAGSSLGREVFRRRMVSWWRRTRIFRSLAASPRGSRASSWMERHRVQGQVGEARQHPGWPSQCR